jgi:hypothetical protein
MWNGAAPSASAPALAVLLFGVFKLLNRRHPRLLARIPPTRLAWWSFLMATAHGPGLMLAPASCWACARRRRMARPMAPRTTWRERMWHRECWSQRCTPSRPCAGIGMAWIVYRYLGLRFLRRAWLNLDAVWGASLVLAGAAGIGLGM